MGGVSFLNKRFFSNTHWLQITAPFYSILFETSICQFNSSTFSPIIPDEVKEHLTRDQRPFLHPESLQIFRFTASPLQFTHSSSTGFRSEDWNGYSRSLVLCSVTHFVLFLRFVLGLLYGWKIQSWPIIRFLTESVTYWFFYPLVFDIIHDAVCLNKMSRTKYRPTTSKIQQYISLYTWDTFYPCVHRTHLECLLLKSNFFFIWP